MTTFSADMFEGNAPNNRSANFYNSDGQFFLVRCHTPECGNPDYGRENYMAAAASGGCAWCGWQGENNPRIPEGIALVSGA